jgi:carbonic anhydrase/acetyltransferase-like protein (isoleucine patch superfamily)
MDEVIIEKNCIVGALSFVPAKTIVPERSLLVGNPAKVIKQVSDEMLAWKTKGTELYQQLPKECFETMNECEPLRQEELNRPSQEKLFETWKSIQNK